MAKHQYIQHRVSSVYSREGIDASLITIEGLIQQGSFSRIEFDVSADEQGKIVVGHPLDLLRDKTITIPQTLEEFLTDILALPNEHIPNEIIVDVKARGWDMDKNEAFFFEGALEALGSKLPIVFQEFQQALVEKGDECKIVVASVSKTFFEYTKEHEVEWSEGVKTRYFVRNSVKNPFEVCEQLGVDQASIQLPAGEKEAILSRLKELRDMRESSAYAYEGSVSAYTIDDVSEAIWIQEVLGEDVEIISNETKRLENMNTEEYVQAVTATRGYRKPNHLDMAMEAIDRRMDQLAEKPEKDVG